MFERQISFHTGLYSDKAEKIISSLLKFAAFSKFNNIEIDREPNNEVILKTEISPYFNNFITKYHSDSYKCKEYFADYIKDFYRNRFIVEHQRDGWSRSEHVNIADNYPFTISEVYCLYDCLKNRKNIDKKYSKEFLTEVIGIERNALETELEIAKRTEKAKLKEKYTALINNADPRNWHSDKYHEIEKKVLEYKDKLIQEALPEKQRLEKEYQDKIKQINNLLINN